MGQPRPAGSPSFVRAGFLGGNEFGLIVLIVVFATLEASIAFCMGCWVYAQLQRAGVFPPDACVDCVPKYLKNA